MWNGISHKSFCPYSILIKTANTNPHIFPRNRVANPNSNHMIAALPVSTWTCMSQHAVLFRSVFPCCVCFLSCGKKIDFFLGGGGGVEKGEKLGASMGRLIGIFSINQRALQLIIELSYSIGELSTSIKECSCWIGELSNSIGEC